MIELMIIWIFGFAVGCVVVGILCMFRFKYLEDQVDKLSEDCIGYSQMYYSKTIPTIAVRPIKKDDFIVIEKEEDNE